MGVLGERQIGSLIKAGSLLHLHSRAFGGPHPVWQRSDSRPQPGGRGLLGWHRSTCYSEVLRAPLQQAEKHRAEMLQPACSFKHFLRAPALTLLLQGDEPCCRVLPGFGSSAVAPAYTAAQPQKAPFPWDAFQWPLRESGGAPPFISCHGQHSHQRHADALPRD